MNNPYPPGMRLFGFNICVTPDHPKRTLAEDVPVSPEFRIEINLWMLGFFGTYNLLDDGQYIHQPNEGVLYTNPRTLAQLKLAMDAENAKNPQPFNKTPW
jgi:hypothetical protein